ncbi:MAG: anthranilate phosphoribosyltransferase [Gammaproteobacteria bacterium]|jgi:anthranilate phosphoribosyltransferase
MTAIRKALQILGESRSLPEGMMRSVMNQIMDGDATPSQIGAYLMASKILGDSVQSICEAAEVMRERAVKVSVTGEFQVDTCGTGGDGIGIFNVSTGAAIVAASVGCCVAKHGNRSVSSTTGSADVLETAGVNLNLTAPQVEQCISQCNIGFLFAPAHHSATKYAVAPRKEIGLRTFFNLLGPLTNPANVLNQIMGVFSKDWLNTTAEVLKKLGANHVIVVHSEDGMDEVSLAAPTNVSELKNGEIVNYSIRPEDFGVKTQSIDGLIVDNAEQSLNLIQQAFSGQKGAAADILALNAGAAIYVSGKAESIKQGVQMAYESLQNGKAQDTFQQLIQITQAFTND